MNRLSHLREITGFSLEQLAAILNRSRPTMSIWMRDEKLIPHEGMEMIKVLRDMECDWKRLRFCHPTELRLVIETFEKFRRMNPSAAYLFGSLLGAAAEGELPCYSKGDVIDGINYDIET